MPDASLITRRAKSNLAFALHILPRQRRQDMVVFYAFCRSLDDLADAPGMPAENRRAALESWRAGLLNGFDNPDSLQHQVLALRDRHSIPTHLLTAIIDGCLRDLLPQRFQSWDDLSEYVWQVACAVGLVSIRLFGCQDPAAEPYAIALGRALQLTNILRDIREDHDNGGRIYLPLDDLATCHYSTNDLAAHIHDQRFLRLMTLEADRADRFFREAADSLPAPDRRALAPARIMAEIYQQLLARMRRDGFRVFEKRYRLPRGRKLAILTKHLIARWF